jgi:hypothetical protein
MQRTPLSASRQRVDEPQAPNPMTITSASKSFIERIALLGVSYLRNNRMPVQHFQNIEYPFPAS